MNWPLERFIVFDLCIIQSNTKHVAHGVFDKNLKDSAWLNRFWENTSVLIFSRPRGNIPSRLCWLDRSVPKASDLRRKIHKPTVTP